MERNLEWRKEISSRRTRALEWRNLRPEWRLKLRFFHLSFFLLEQFPPSVLDRKWNNFSTRVRTLPFQYRAGSTCPEPCRLLSFGSPTPSLPWSPCSPDLLALLTPIWLPFSTRSFFSTLSASPKLPATSDLCFWNWIQFRYCVGCASGAKQQPNRRILAPGSSLRMKTSARSELN